MPADLRRAGSRFMAETVNAASRPCMRLAWVSATGLAIVAVSSILTVHGAFAGDRAYEAGEVRTPSPASLPDTPARKPVTRIIATSRPVSERDPLENVTLPRPFGSPASEQPAMTRKAQFTLTPLMVERGNVWSTAGASETAPAAVTDEEAARKLAEEEAAARRASALAAAARERSRAARAASLEAARRKREKSYAEYFRGD